MILLLKIGRCYRNMAHFAPLEISFCIHVHPNTKAFWFHSDYSIPHYTFLVEFRLLDSHFNESTLASQEYYIGKPEGPFRSSRQVKIIFTRL